MGPAMITIKLKGLLSMVPLHGATFFDNDLLVTRMMMSLWFLIYSRNHYYLGINGESVSSWLTYRFDLLWKIFLYEQRRLVL